jgi:type IV secretory pathway ATPase VirB11/archaellum biosynthesis ATPase
VWNSAQEDVLPRPANAVRAIVHRHHLKASSSAPAEQDAGLIYEDKRASYRTEVDQALRANPDVIVLGGYVPTPRSC